MTELEQLRADLATLEKTRDLLKSQNCPNIALGVQSICELTLKRIAGLEAQQTPADEWLGVRLEINAFAKSLAEDPTPSGHFTVKTPAVSAFIGYVRHLEAKVAELDHELRCERIDGGKVRDDLKARIAEMEQHGRKVDQANHERYKRLRDQIAIRDLKIEKLEGQEPYEKNLVKLAELTTILNAIPPACGLARELVERWIEVVKKEMQA